MRQKELSPNGKTTKNHSRIYKNSRPGGYEGRKVEIMTLKVKYDRVDFFGHRQYTEDITSFAVKKNIIKAFTFSI